jgi:pilus assembly protein CpaF
MSQHLPAAASKIKWQDQCGPLATLLTDSSITEIMVNGTQKIFIEQKGLLKKTALKFDSDDQLNALMMAMCASVGRNLSRDNPCVDARLPDGSRINCVVAPVAVDGAALTIRKFSPFAKDPEQLVAAGMLDERLAYFLSCCVAARMNLVVCGGTGSGKTTLLNALSSYIPMHERVVTIEDSAELKIKNDNVVRLEARPAIGTDAPITIRQLVINALRMRPDRILVGECRGSEALDMLIAMNTGHEGSMTTLHANSAREALRRLESMILMSGIDLPIKVVRQNISGAIELIVNVQRFADGTRRVSDVIEIGGMEGDVILTQEIFEYQLGAGFKHSGFVPGFVQKFRERGVDFPSDFFTDAYTVKNTKKKQ